MDGPIVFAEVLADELICACASSKSCHKESCAEDIKCVSGCMDNNAICPSTLDASSILEKDELMVQVLGIALKGFLHIHDTHELLPGSTSSSNEVFSSQREVLPIDVIVDGMDESENSVAARGSMLDSQSLTEEKDELASLQSDGSKYQEEGAICITPLLTNATHMELISALKGGREQQGMLPKGKLSVKWAPEVYDPPVTSASHTVRGYQHRSKVRKDHHKHKYVKGRSSRGSSSSDKKHAKTKRSTYSSTVSRILRCQDPTVDKLNMNAFDQQNAEIRGMEW